MRRNIAVVLFNLGGPESLSSVRSFLFNLFNDKHIIPLPQPLRFVVASMISIFRNKKSQGIYAQIGGKSTILAETQKQVSALESYLNTHCSVNKTITYDVMPMMRYSHPNSKDVIKDIKNNHYTDIVLLPLYPQYSTTTTLSTLRDWFKRTEPKNTSLVCCYPQNEGFIEAYADLLQITLAKIIDKKKTIRILFSAHSIPQYLVDNGDPYQSHVNYSVRAIVKKLDLDNAENMKYSICYQSKVGRMKWLEPDIKSEILAAGKRGEIIIVLPISFTSEHSETLVELDIEYANLAKEHSIEYHRVPTVSAHPIFIQTLASLTINALGKGLKEHCQLGKYKNADNEIVCLSEMCCKQVVIY